MQVSKAQEQSSELNGLAESFSEDYAKVVKAAGKTLSDKSVKVKAGVLRLLRELLLIAPGRLASSTLDIAPGILHALKVSLVTRTSVFAY